MEKRIVECVPNFSEGRDKAIIRQITSAIESSGGVKLLDVDPGEATNRTVVTFVGSPEAVVEAAFAGVKRAAELIDMRRHKGAHPRMGATDVLPLIPICGITLAECAELARKLAERIAAELHVPTYCYEAAAFIPERRNLAVCRAGEYEALPEKLAHKETAREFGARPCDDGVARTGATTVGARDFLIAVNFNLNTTSTRRANAIAFDVREKGRPVREGNPITGKVVKDAAGNPVMQPGTLPATKAIGWFIEEYGIAQVSMNITDIATTPLHVAFDEVCRKADARGVRVTGTEIVGLVPKRALIEAGKYFLRKQRRSTGIAEQEIVRIAVRSMGLDDLKPFDPAEKVIEYLLEAEDKQKRLIDMTCKGFAEELRANPRHRAAARSRPTWERWAQPSVRWSPTSRRIRRGGTTAGRSFPIGPTGDRRCSGSCCTSWTRIRRHSTASWPSSPCPSRRTRRRPPAARPCRRRRSMRRRCPCGR